MPDVPAYLNATPALLLIVLALAVYRAARFVVWDEFIGEYPEMVPDPDADPDDPDPPEVPRPLENPLARHDDPTTRWLVYPDGVRRLDRGTGLRHLIDWLLVDRHGEPRNAFTNWLGKLYACPYCVGVWATLLVLAAWWIGWAWLCWAVIVAAVAGVQAFLASRPGG